MFRSSVARTCLLLAVLQRRCHTLQRTSPCMSRFGQLENSFQKQNTCRVGLHTTGILGSDQGGETSQYVPDVKNPRGVVKEGEDPLSLTEEDWKQRLDPHVYHVIREQGTERAFTGNLVNHHGKGLYTCAGCGAELFRSEHKFESGSGWPSFWQVKGAKGQDDSNTNITRHTDDSYGMKRVEVLCKRCLAHLGHVFDDGPQPTGLRYCMNSAALQFQKDDDSEKGKL